MGAVISANGGIPLLGDLDWWLGGCMVETTRFVGTYVGESNQNGVSGCSAGNETWNE